MDLFFLHILLLYILHLFHPKWITLPTLSVCRICSKSENRATTAVPLCHQHRLHLLLSGHNDHNPGSSGGDPALDVVVEGSSMVQTPTLVFVGGRKLMLRDRSYLTRVQRRFFAGAAKFPKPDPPECPVLVVTGSWAPRPTLHA
ncbi:hypothetical protein BGW80DRAFT_707967 [Lactifluus volemus]|nr:hypothetical protein BGW80DRAFT_707967 [Lactifluus volemus]